MSTKLLKTGLGSGNGGYEIIHHSITGIIVAGFVVVGFELKKLRSTTSSQGRQKTYLTPIIFNLPMGDVIMRKVVDVGSRK